MSAERRRPVLLHIQDAESWLSRAKTEYQTANDVRGELDLSLAQAEVKYAWELSRSGRKTAMAGPAARRSMARWMLPLAACLGLGILAIAWPRLAGHQPEGRVAVRPQPAVTAPQPAGLPNTPNKPKTPNTPKTSPQNPPAAAVRPSAAPPVILEQPPEETPAVPIVPPAPTTSAVVAPESPIRPVVPPADNARPASSNNGTALDLDELARMAQETLTSGESVSGGQH